MTLLGYLSVFQSYSSLTTEGNAQFEVRLLGSTYPNQGRVEIRIYNSVFYDDWGTICDDSWGLADADVVCRQLGFDGAAQAVPGSTFSPGSGPIWLDDVECTGYEATLDMCRYSPIGEHNCQHSEDAGLVCNSNMYPQTPNGNYEDGKAKNNLFIISPFANSAYPLLGQTLCRSKPMIRPIFLKLLNHLFLRTDFWLDV